MSNALDKDMQKILITGSNGMVGKNIVSFRNDKNYILLTPNRDKLDLSDRKCIDAYIKEHKPDGIIHCAGKVGGIQANIANPVKFLSENMQIGLNIILASFEAGIKYFINMGSSCMYPKNAKNPLKEDLILSGELEPTNEGYALAKISSTRLCEYISRQDSKFIYKTIIPCNLYGKYDKFDPQHSHMIPSVIKKLHDAKINDTPVVEIWGDGEARREFMYAEDLADFVYYAIDNFSLMPQNINVGLGFDYTINEYYKIVAKVVGYKGEFLHNLDKPVGMEQKLIDDTKLKEFGWKYKTSLEDGIQKTYKYYLKEFLSE